jgi:hypothetical protein
MEWGKLHQAAVERHHKDGECEIDDDATVSFSHDDGAYVMAWVWIYNADADLPSTKGV